MKANKRYKGLMIIIITIILYDLTCYQSCELAMVCHVSVVMPYGVKPCLTVIMRTVTGDLSSLSLSNLRWFKS